MKRFACWLIPRLRPFSALGVMTLLGLVSNIREHPERLTRLLPYLSATIVADIAVAVWATAFTYRNYDEVVAGSKRWQRGNVEGKNSRPPHCVGVFVQSLFAFWGMLAIMIGVAWSVFLLCRAS